MGCYSLFLPNMTELTTFTLMSGNNTSRAGITSSLGNTGPNPTFLNGNNQLFLTKTEEKEQKGRFSPHSKQA